MRVPPRWGTLTPMSVVSASRSCEVMRTLGVDLSTDPRRTALCLLEWPADGSPALVIEILVGADDETILSVGGNRPARGNRRTLRLAAALG